MKKTLALILTFIMVLALVPSVAFAAGNTIYVDATNGNDTTGDGTETKPYKTVEAAAKAAVSGDTIMLGEGNYTLYGVSSEKTTKTKDLTFVGQGADKTGWNIGAVVPDPANFGTEYNGDYSFDGAGTITFRNMTLRSGAADYLGFIRADKTIVDNCTVNGKTFYWGYTSATFTKTTFNCPAGDYAVWTYSSPEMTFDECTFNSSGKVINVYTDYGAGKHDITVNFKNCTVNNEEGTSKKPVLNINDSNMDKFKYVLNIAGDNKVTGVDADNITHSSLFGFGGKADTNNKGKTVVKIDDTTVWQDGNHATGTLTVKKTVSGGGADYNKAFTFTVTLKMPEITVDALATPIINATPDTSAAPTPVTETYDGVTFINGVATFTLKHNESKTIKDIPAGYTYTVTESDNAGYTVTMSGNTGIIKAGETLTAAFNNYKAGGGGNGGGYYNPTTTPVPVIVIPPKTGDMTVWQSILHFLGIR